MGRNYRLARKLVKTRFPGEPGNFLTQTVIDFGVLENNKQEVFAYELSTDRHNTFCGLYICGVTVVQQIKATGTVKSCHKLSTSFNDKEWEKSHQMAKKYIEELEELVKKPHGWFVCPTCGHDFLIFDNPAPNCDYCTDNGEPVPLETLIP